MLDRLGRNAARHHWWFIRAWLVAAVLCVVIAVTLDGQTNDSSRPGCAVAEGARSARGAVPEPVGRDRDRRVQRAAGCRRPAGAVGDRGEHCQPREAPTRLERREPDRVEERSVRGQDRRVVTVQYDTQAQDVGLDSVQAPATGHPAGGRRRSAAGVRRRGRRLRRTARRRATPTSSVCSPRSSSCSSRSARWSRWASRSSPRCSVSASASSLVSIVARRSPTIGTLAPTLATMIGLGVGIDYSLFIVTRYRENVADGIDDRRGGRSLGRDGGSSGVVRRNAPS